MEAVRTLLFYKILCKCANYRMIRKHCPCYFVGKRISVVNAPSSELRLI